MVVAPAQSMRIISWNLLHGQIIPPNNDQDWRQSLITAAKTVANNYQPDFIGLQEVDYLQPRSTLINQTQLVAESMGLKYWAYLPSLFGTPGEKWEKVRDLKAALITQDTTPPEEISYGIGIATNQRIKKLHVKKLGRSIIGLPLVIPNENGRVRFIYVKDEPRVALTAELENGLTITTTHLSFAPVVNIYQLNLLCTTLNRLPGKQVLIGDLNMIANLPSRFSSYKSLIKQMTYPSWKEKIQFDYIMAPKSTAKSITTTPINTVKTNISDHTPIGVELRFE
ncbi:MAG: metal-dependent hydrolase [Actinobacteria bacterium]|nr:metal-dependent hydrolase [Actinomycetota bacterium]